MLEAGRRQLIAALPVPQVQAVDVTDDLGASGKKTLQFLDDAPGLAAGAARALIQLEEIGGIAAARSAGGQDCNKAMPRIVAGNDVSALVHDGDLDRQRVQRSVKQRTRP